jgi:hypothetical protein
VRSKDGRRAGTNRLTFETTKEEHMPYGSCVNDLPTGFFVAVHEDIDGTVILR